MAGCLTERGHTIVGWEKTGKKMKVDLIGEETEGRPDRLIVRGVLVSVVGRIRHDASVWNGSKTDISPGVNHRAFPA